MYTLILKFRTLHVSYQFLVSDIPWYLTHWGRVMHICIGNQAIIGSDNGLPPGRWQAIILTNATILFIWPIGTNISDIVIEICTYSFRKVNLKIWLPHFSQIFKHLTDLFLRIFPYCEQPCLDVCIVQYYDSRISKAWSNAIKVITKYITINWNTAVSKHCVVTACNESLIVKSITCLV